MSPFTEQILINMQRWEMHLKMVNIFPSLLVSVKCLHSVTNLNQCYTYTHNHPKRRGNFWLNVAFQEKVFYSFCKLGGGWLAGDKNGSCTFEGRISTAGDERWISFSIMEDMLWLPRSLGTRPGKHCASNAGARIVVSI